MLAGLLNALVDPARQLGIPSLPRAILNVAAPDLVGGRRAYESDGRAVIEVHGIEAYELGDRDAAERVQRLERALASCPGVRCVRVNAPLGRVIVTVGEPAPALAQLVAVVNEVEASPEAAPVDAPAPAATDRSPTYAVDPLPATQGGFGTPTLALVADAAAVVLAGVGRASGLGALPVELASIVSAVDTIPRLRGVVEGALGPDRADAAIALANATVQGLARGLVGLAVDAAYRVLELREAGASASAWEQARHRYDIDPGERLATGPARAVPLVPGPIEAWANQSGMLAGAAFTFGAISTGDPRRAAGLALAAIPRAARLGREAFATQLGRSLALSGAVVADRRALRRLDRISTVVLDADVLVTGRYLVDRLVPVNGSDQNDVTRHLYRLFRAEDPLAVQVEEEWRLGPLDDLALDLTSARHVRSVRRVLEEGRPHVVLGLTRDDRLVALAAALHEPSESLDALAAATHRSGCRLVVAGDADPTSARVADLVLPGGDRLGETLDRLQSDGSGVLLLSRRREALARADLGIGVDDAYGAAPWGADVLIGRDLARAVMLIDGCLTARSVSGRSVALAQGATALGGIAATAHGTSPVAPRSLLAVNLTAAAALAMGTWAAIELARRPISPPVSRVPWHAMPAELVLARLGSSAEGLATAAVSRRRERASETAPDTGFLTAVAEELANPLTPILAAGAALSAAVGSVVDAGLVAGVTLASALLGGVQRGGTEHALARLLAESAVMARVHRDGQEQVVPADQLVPGDVIALAPGDVVPADCRILVALELEMDESSLTGEAFPVTKSVDAVLSTVLAERTSMLYEGTTVAAGRGTGVVVATGNATEAGRSIAATRSGQAPGGVEARLAQITRVTVPITLASAAAVVTAGLAHGRTVATTLGAGVSLAVAAVPEGLPFLVTAAQLAAARRLSGLGALVRKPRTIEALGRVDVLCFDKTGTLTEGRISLAAVIDAGGEQHPIDELSTTAREVLAAGLRATPEPRPGHQLAHLTDRAVADGAADASIARSSGLGRWRRLAALPFEPSRSFHATLGGDGTKALLSVKGAPEVVLPRCSRVRRRGKDVPIEAPERRRLTAQVERLAGRGYRVLAVAERVDTPRDALDDGDVDDLVLLGYLALADPLRPAAGASVDALRRAGIQIVMITGDHPHTAAAIAQRLDLLDGQRVITGPELDTLDDAALDAVLPFVAVVARSTPAHKVRVVQSFQRLHRTVAMTGDGANDAPAIRLADVGIALGRRGTPAARAAADLVVTDDRLETILAALIEGRAMWGSVRRALGILVGGNLGEIAFTVLGAILTGTSPLAARQLLLVNLLTDLAPALAVALRPPQAESAEALLAEGPEASLGSALTRDVGVRALITTGGALAAWLAAAALGYGTAASTIALAALVGTQLGQTLLAGGLTRGVLGSSAASLAGLALVIETPGVSTFFASSPLGPAGWAVAAVASAGATVLGSAFGHDVVKRAAPLAVRAGSSTAHVVQELAAARDTLQIVSAALSVVNPAAYPALLATRTTAAGSHLVRALSPPLATTGPRAYA